MVAPVDTLTTVHFAMFHPSPYVSYILSVRQFGERTLVGVGVGAGLGRDVGSEVGSSVGAGTGTGVGTGIGTGVGAGEGAAVGLKVGKNDIVGAGVGAGDGAGVGMNVGAIVPDCLILPKPHAPVFSNCDNVTRVPSDCERYARYRLSRGTSAIVMGYVEFATKLSLTAWRCAGWWWWTSGAANKNIRRHAFT